MLARHLWGVTKSYATAFAEFKKQGYKAIEAGLVFLQEPQEIFFKCLDEFNLQWIPMVFTQGKSVADHINSFKSQVLEVAKHKPLLINSHSGRDAFNREDAVVFFREALKIQNDVGIPVAHETHRSRILYNPWITKDILLELPALQICSDYSHWVTVCERLIDDEFEIFKLCAERCLHIHARVGYEQGPQVPDPRLPEYQSHVATHEQWWDMIWQAQRAAKRKITTLTPEFGPAPYLQAHISNSTLEEICLWQMQRQRERFARNVSPLKRGTAECSL